MIAWTRAASSTVSPTPPHVMYLTNAYKAGLGPDDVRQVLTGLGLHVAEAEFAAWEVERLTRKHLGRVSAYAFSRCPEPRMLLTLAAAMLPVTLAPALQLACLSVILTISLLCFLRLVPVSRGIWAWDAWACLRDSGCKSQAEDLHALQGASACPSHRAHEAHARELVLP